jgi:hypothetical protein
MKIADSTPTSLPLSTYLGLFLVSCGGLFFQLLLTRIFSVTLWYHFGFMVVSVALFGMTAGALTVYMLNARLRPEHIARDLSASALLFSLFALLGFMIHLGLPVVRRGTAAINTGPLALTYLLLAIPFFFAGINVTLALTRLTVRVGKLYAADLIGAASGCILFAVGLEVMDGPTAAFFVAGLLCFASLAYAWNRQAPRFLQVTAALLGIGLAGFVLLHRQQVQAGTPWVALRYVRGEVEGRPLYERWNSFSRLTIWGDPEAEVPAFGFGFPQGAGPTATVRQLRLAIDAGADTYLTAFGGDPEEVAFLKSDVTYAAHTLRPDSRVLVVGSGGGRDLLAALAFTQPSILGVEVNADIVDLVHGVLGEFTGHLEALPGVRVVQDEARSFIARQVEPFDILQLSLIDTWAASSAGAFVLTEHSLYTLEAWQNMLEHLSKRGVLSVSRWYFPDNPYETYRLVALGAAALESTGVEDPRQHMLLLTNLPPDADHARQVGIATLLISRSPLSPDELERMEAYADRLGFYLLLAPGAASDPLLAEVASMRDLEALSADLPESILPPSDDRPFFFFGVRLSDLLTGRFAHASLAPATGAAVYILSLLLTTVTGLAVLTLLVPIVVPGGAKQRTRSWPLFLYFAAIGCAFMLIEVSQLQRLTIFLGHPTYGLTVALFTLLLAAGIGSWTTHAVAQSRSPRATGMRLIALLVVLVLYALLAPVVMEACKACPTPVRILVSILMLFPVGFFMGMPFPLGMQRAALAFASLRPWLYGINGATSVAASVLAVILALTVGLRLTFLSGALCYLLALGALYRTPVE